MAISFVATYKFKTTVFLFVKKIKLGIGPDAQTKRRRQTKFP